MSALALSDAGRGVGVAREQIFLERDNLIADEASDGYGGSIAW